MRAVLAEDVAFWPATRQVAAIRARVDLARHVEDVVARFEPPPL